MKKNTNSTKKTRLTNTSLLNKNGAESNSILFWSLLFFSVIFLFWAPYYRALFNGYTVDFERSIDSALIWGAIALFALAIYLFYHWRLEDVRDGLMIFVWFIPITYFISFIYAESSYLSRNMLYIQIFQAAFFMIGAEFARNRRALNYIIFGIMGSGFLIILFGIMHWFGSAGWLMKPFVSPGSPPVYNDAVMMDSNGYRLTSVFQYANTYAAYLIALLFSSAFLVIQSKRWQLTLVNAWILVPIILSFMLTLSRGAMVVIPFVLIIVLLFLPLYRQILLLLHLGVAGIASLLILERVTTIGQQVQQGAEAAKGAGWALLLVASCTTAAISWLIQRYIAPWLKQMTERKFRFQFISIALPVLIVLAGSIGAVVLFTDTGVVNMLPDNIKTRIENINFAQHSVLERGTFYKDAMKLFRDYPVLGAGGGAWAALYEKYQNNPYSSMQAHSFIFQYIAEVGAVGVIFLLIFLFTIFYYYTRHYLKSSADDRGLHFVFFIFVVSLLIHSMIDFDMSYVYLASLVFLCLGGMSSTIRIQSKGLQFFTRNQQNLKLVKKIFPTALALVSIILFVISIRLLSANTAFLQAHTMAVQEKPFPQVMEKLNTSLQLAKNHPNYTLFKVSLLHQAYEQTKDEQYFEQAVQAIDSLKKAEPHNRGAIELQFYQFISKGQLEQALQLLDQQIANFPWFIDFYEHRIGLNFQLGNWARLENNLQAMDLYWDAAFEIYDVVNERIEHLSKLPKEQLQGEKFEVTPKIAVSLGQIEYIRGNYKGASDILQQVIGQPLAEPSNLYAARWYLAALHMQGKENKSLYDRVIAQDPEEAVQIENLIMAAKQTN